MGAAQSSPGSDFGRPANNQHAVAALMAYKHAQLQATKPSSSGSVPPPGCPMHNNPEMAQKMLKQPSAPPTPQPQPQHPKVQMPTSSAGQCPIPHDQRDAYVVSQQQARGSSPGPGFGAGSMAPAESSGSGSGSGSGSTSSWSSKLNPLNMMPSLSQSRAPEQKSLLSTERVVSSIPRAQSSPAPGASPYDSASACPVKHDGSAKEDQTDKWEYPSPQQFYNALVRKGWETPEEHVETMVLIHNFLNEQAWMEVLEWEKLAGADSSRAELARFQGKPGTLSPKARMFGLAAWLMPNTFSSEPPFDRHDWVVRRPDQDGREVRYVIDYYSVPDDPEKDDPEFVLDVRPALDSFESLSVRFRKGLDEWKAGEGPLAGLFGSHDAGSRPEEALEQAKGTLRKGEERLKEGAEAGKSALDEAKAKMRGSN